MVSTSPDWFQVRLAMEVAARNAREAGPYEAFRSLYGDAVPPRQPARAVIPPEAVQPWPARPPYRLCEAQPGRWEGLRAERDPVPEWFEGTAGTASWHRAMGWPVERALRESPAGCWWFDPELPLACCMGGFPEWDMDGERPDTGESAWEFARIVRDYEPEIAAGAVFPPLVVYAVEPAADRPAAGLQRYAAFVPAWWTNRPHYVLGNGRHRAAAAWRAGLREFPAFVLGPCREMYEVALAHGDGWLLPVAEVARERGRFGLPAEMLAEAGPVRVADGADTRLDREALDRVTGPGGDEQVRLPDRRVRVAGRRHSPDYRLGSGGDARAVPRAGPDA